MNLLKDSKETIKRNISNALHALIREIKVGINQN